LAQIRSAVPEIFHTQTKNTDWRRQKQNLPQFTACGKDLKRYYFATWSGLPNEEKWSRKQWTDEL